MEWGDVLLTATSRWSGRGKTCIKNRKRVHSRHAASITQPFICALKVRDEPDVTVLV